MYEEITSLSIALISLAGTALTVFCIWFLKEQVGESRIVKANELLKKVNEEFLLKQTWALDAVHYAEQVFFGKGAAKKYDAAMEFVASKAQAHGINLNPNELKVIIEAQLHKIESGTKNSWTEIVTKSPVIVAESPKDLDSTIESSIANAHNNLNL